LSNHTNVFYYRTIANGTNGVIFNNAVPKGLFECLNIIILQEGISATVRIIAAISTGIMSCCPHISTS